MERATDKPVRDLELTDVILAVAREVNSAIDQHGMFNSAHEAYGVLAEEVEEFWEEVRKKRSNRSLAQMRAELIQVAAVAVKAVMSFPPAISTNKAEKR